jgi:hypothetical protein
MTIATAAPHACRNIPTRPLEAVVVKVAAVLVTRFLLRVVVVDGIIVGGLVVNKGGIVVGNVGRGPSRLAKAQLTGFPLLDINKRSQFNFLVLSCFIIFCHNYRFQGRQHLKISNSNPTQTHVFYLDQQRFF